MTPEFFEGFLPLWGRFERGLREKYMELIMAGALDTLDPTARVLSNVYEKLGWDFWHFRGAGAPWKTQLEEVFSENKYYELLSKLDQYNGLDALVADSLKGKDDSLKAASAHALFWGKRDRTNMLYTQALKPCLDKRKQELLEGFRGLAQELRQPIPYSLDLRLEKEETRLTLEFQSKCKKSHLGKGMDGYTYSFNGRSYRDYESLWTEEAETIAPGVFLGRDIYGESVLGTRRNLPTFDSSDREWDSRVMEFLFFDGANVHLLVVRGGYKIATLTFYERLLSADSRMKPLFERLGWPLSGIGWK